MTQPTSVNMTFDTSLVDLNPNASFSTTESDTSDFDTLNPATTTPTIQQSSLFQDQSSETPRPSQHSPAELMPPPPRPSAPVQHVPTQDAYDQWASIYDSDGNMLQSIDDLELETLLPELITNIAHNTAEKEITLLDLGCGTGRNTAKLLSWPWQQDHRVSVTGLDFSKGMLDVASQKLRPLLNSPEKAMVSLHLSCCDCFPTVHNPSASPLPPAPNLTPVHAIISTLVLEHIALAPFFATLAALLRPRGLALVSNMHPDMGRLSQAGFVNPHGVKVRGNSFAHTLADTVDHAARAGFDVLIARERAVHMRDVEAATVGDRGRKWVGVKVWYGLVLRKQKCRPD